MNPWIISIKLFLCIIVIGTWNVVDLTDNPSQSQSQPNPGQTGPTPVTNPDPELKLYTNDTEELDSKSYDLDKSTENSLAYKFKDKVKCTLVKCDGKQVWKLDTSTTTGNPLSLLFNVKAKVVLLTFKDDLFCSYKLDKDQWKEQFKGKPEPVTLDTKSTSGTDKYDHHKDGKVVTFTAKENNVFNTVKAKDKEIWKTDKKEEYAVKVVLKGKGSKSKEVVIYSLNGQIKGYQKDGKNKPWVEGSLTSNGDNIKTDLKSRTEKSQSLQNLSFDLVSKSKSSTLYDKAYDFYNQVKLQTDALENAEIDDKKVKHADSMFESVDKAFNEMKEKYEKLSDTEKNSMKTDFEKVENKFNELKKIYEILSKETSSSSTSNANKTGT